MGGIHPINHGLGHFAFIPHGHCYLWKPGMVWLHVISDGGIVLAYFSIATALIYFAERRRDLPYPWLFQLFSAFIIACGLTHAMEIWTLWHPTYWVSGAIKSVTAMVSMLTATTLIPVIPEALALPSQQELEAAKEALEDQVRDRTESLRLSEERLQLALAGSGDGLWDWNIATGEVYFSPRWQNMLGYASGELPRKLSTWYDLIHPEDQPWVMERLNQHLQDSRIPFTLDYRLRTRSGDWAWIGCYGRVVATDEQGQPVRMAGTHKDIGDRKRAEAERQMTERQLRDLTDRLGLAVRSANMGIWDWDVNTNCLVWDDRMYEMYGFEPAEFEGIYAAWEASLHPEDVTQCRSAAQQALAGEIDYEIEFRIIWPDGSIRHIASYGLVQRDPAGQPLRMIGANLDITDRKRAESDRLRAESLRLQLTLLESLLDTVLAGYWDWHIPRHYNYMSPGLKRMLGYAEEELPNLPETWQSLIFEEDLPTALDCLDRHVKSHGEVPYYNEVRYRHKDGSTIWVICSGRVIKWDASGQPVRMIGCHVDITKLKQTEAQLQKSDTHLRLAQRIGNLGSWEFDLPDETITWSDQVFHIFGRDPALGTPSFAELQQMFHPDDRDLHQQTVQWAIASAQPYDLECRIHRPDGRWVHIQAKGEPILDEAGQVVQMVGTILDITDRKQAEVQKQMLSDRLTLALQSGAIGSWDWNLVEDAIWDERMYEIYGLQELGRAAVYQDWADCLYADDLPSTEAALQAAIRGERDFNVEFRIWRTDGELRWVKAMALVKRDENGHPLRMTGINFDITESKLAEDHLLKTTAQLEASNRELEAFAYSVSHDLRSPLRAIDGFSKALLEDYGDQFNDEGKDYFDRIRHNVHRMGLLIDDLLSLSRVSRSEMQYTTVDLSRLAQEQADQLRASDPDRQVEIVIIPNVRVSADLTLMRVVINNLLENAWKFTSHHATARIEFGLLQQGDRPIYFVRDDGAGFDMAYATMLFGVFQRLHSTTEFPGTGIGLATVQRAIHRHGGQVWADAAVEQGATLYFTIPSYASEQRSDL